MEAFQNSLTNRIKVHEKDIERMCNKNYQGFIESVSELLKVKADAMKIKVCTTHLPWETYKDLYPLPPLSKIHSHTIHLPYYDVPYLLLITYHTCSSSRTIPAPHHVPYLLLITYHTCSSSRTIPAPHRVPYLLLIAYHTCSSSRTIPAPHHVPYLLLITYHTCSSSRTIPAPHHVPYLLLITYHTCSSSCTIPAPHHVP